MTDSEHSQIEIRRARSLADYLFLRSLRNSVRLSMTNHTGSISYLAQLRFYLRQPANMDVYIACLGTRRAGYLLLRHEGSTTLITEAVDESCRGRGIATRMVRHAQRLHENLTAEILEDNIASIRLHQTTGFALVSTQEGIQTFRYSRPRE